MDQYDGHADPPEVPPGAGCAVGSAGGKEADPDKEAPPQPGWWKRNHEYVRTIATCLAAVAASVAVVFNYRALSGAQRAWVLFDNEAPNVASVRDDAVTIYVRNFGHSPAREIQAYREWVFDPKSKVILFDLSEARFLPPDRRLEIAIPWTRRNEQRGLLNVTVTYRDQFGRHTSAFCIDPREDGSVVECESGWGAD